MQSTRIKISSIVESQLPAFVRVEYPLVEQLLKEYYSSLDSASLPYDILSNIDQYVKVDNIADGVDSTTLGSSIDFDDESIVVSSTKGFPKTYGLIKIDDEIILYKLKTDTSFLECSRGFSGVTRYSSSDIEDLEFSTSQATSHTANASIQNLSGLFLKHFFGKLKKQFLPGFEGRELYEGVRESTFLKNAKDFYTSKGTSKSFEILFRCLYGEDVNVILPKDNLITPSESIYEIKRNFVVSPVQGDPEKLINQTIFQDQYENLRKSFGTISNVEKIIRGDNVFYNLQVDSTINNPYQNLKIHSKTHTTTAGTPGSNKITVDSTLSFEKSGEIVVSFDNRSYLITYTDKTINQFLNCTSEDIDVRDIPAGADVNINSFAYGFASDGEEIRFRFNGVISETNLTDGSLYYNKNDIGRLLSLGYDATSSLENNWIINNSVRCNVESSTKKGTQYEIKTFDKNNIRDNDLVEVEYINEFGNNIRSTLEATVSLSSPEKTFLVPINQNNITVRSVKRLIGISSAGGFMNDVLNVYKDFSSDDVYVTSSSLPSYYDENLSLDYKFDLDNALPIGISTTNLIIASKFNTTEHGLVTGDAIVYRSDNSTPRLGISTGVYFINKVDKNIVNLSRSRSDLFNKNYISFASTTSSIENEYLQLQEFDKKISSIDSQRLVRKFSKPKNSKEIFKTLPGTTGLLVNGVEVLNYKTRDFIYYGDIERIDVISSSSDLDIINPPVLGISSAKESLDNAKGFCGVDGSLSRIDIVDPGFDYIDTPIIAISGGSGSGAKAKAQLVKYNYSASFDASSSNQSISLNTDQIGFSTYHRFRSGEYVIYETFGSVEIGGLVNEATYYVNNINDLNISLHKTEEDAFSDVNRVNLTAFGKGTHSFRSVKKKKRIASITILDSGSGYKNKKVKVNSTGINTASNTINTTQHPYQSGEIIYYFGGDSNIAGLSTGNYIVTRLNNQSFKLSKVGTGNTQTTFFYDTKQYVNLVSQGSGLHEFNYDNIVVSVEGPLGSPSSLPGNEAKIQPVFRGSLDSISLFDGGVGYGSSEIINFNKQPEITLTLGSGARVTPIISNGKIVNVIVYQPGSGYNSPPDIRISGTGTGAILTPIVENGRLKEVIVINSGKNYGKFNTLVDIVSPLGEYNLISYPKVKTINLYQKISSLFTGTQNNKPPSDDNVVYGGRNIDFGIQFTHLYAPNKLRERIFASNLQQTLFRRDKENDESDAITKYHSPIIGWAYDGNPIYGPYGFESITDKNVRLIKSSYKLLELDEIPNRPSQSQFPRGFFIEDYVYDSTVGDLDKNNGRFCITPEFPQGVYAYFMTAEQPNSGTDLIPTFPYIIGDSYHSDVIDFNLKPNANQDKFDFTNLVRNTGLYNSLSLNSNYEYFLNISKVNLQNSIVNKTNLGNIDSLNIISAGDNYKVEDKIYFSDNVVSSSKAIGEISRISGREILKVSNNSKEIKNVELYPAANRTKFVAFSTTPHNLNQDDIITIDTLSRENLSFQSTFKVNIQKQNELILSVGVTDASITGVATYFNVIGNLNYPNIRENDILKIDQEKVKVLNIDARSSRIRVLREQESTVSAPHSSYTKLTEESRKLFIDLPKEAANEKYNLNRELYFDPAESVGIGTSESALLFSNPGSGITSLLVPEKSIFIESHNLRTGDLIVYNSNGGDSIEVSLDGTTAFDLPQNQNLYAVRFNDNLIGISTNKITLSNDGTYVGVGSTANILYFNNIGNEKYHSFTTNYENSLSGNINLYKTTVSTATTHNLRVGDTIFMEAKPRNGVTFVVKYDEYNQRLVINPKDFEKVGVDVENNTFTIENHNYNTGDKVIHTSEDPNSELNTEGIYYISVFNENKVKLHNSYYDSTNKLNEIGISTNFSGTLSAINPKIDIIRDNNVIFDLGDESLNEKIAGGVLQSAFDFRLYTDDGLSDELISISEDNNNISILGVSNVQYSGSIGIDSTAKLEFTTSSLTNNKIYYDLVATGSKSIIRDDEVRNSNEIIFIDSALKGNKTIIGIGSTSFDFYNQRRDFISNYTNSLNSFSYTTNSKNAFGPIDKVRLISSGSQYEELPFVSNIDTNSGSNALLIPQSKTIGSILTTKIKDIGYDYSSDPTLKPLVKYATKYRVEPLTNVESIRVLTPGFNYITNPDIILIDKFTKEPILDLILDYQIEEDFVRIIQNTKGIYNIVPEVVVFNNSNGVGISSVFFDSIDPNKPVTLFLSTIFGSLDVFPFEVGDKIFIEGINVTEEITNESLTRGYNSDNYGYRTFEVFEINPQFGGTGAYIKYSLSDYIESSQNPGTWDNKKTGSVVNVKNFPTFEINLAKNNFEVKEPISNGEITGIVNDWEPNNEYLTVELDRDFIVGDLVIGESTKSQAFIKEVLKYEVFYQVDSSSVVIEGWKDKVGFLNYEEQRIQDSDYYQKFSYALESRVQFETWSNDVNNLNHTLGFKKFATYIFDSDIDNVGIQTGSGSFDAIVELSKVIDIECISDFDLVSENFFYVNNILNSDEIIFNSVIILDYSESIGNRVLIIDDISDEFNSQISQTFVTSFNI